MTTRRSRRPQAVSQAPVHSELALQPHSLRGLDDSRDHLAPARALSTPLDPWGWMARGTSSACCAKRLPSMHALEPHVVCGTLQTSSWLACGSGPCYANSSFTAALGPSHACRVAERTHPSVLTKALWLLCCAQELCSIVSQEKVEEMR